MGASRSGRTSDLAVKEGGQGALPGGQRLKTRFGGERLEVSGFWFGLGTGVEPTDAESWFC